MAHFGIIGAGISGLTLAWKLKLQGHRVTVWEANPAAGGVIGSLRQGQWLAETGPNSIQDSDDSVTELVESLGLSPTLLEASAAAKRRYIVRGKKPVLVPNSPISAITTPLFSAGAKIGVLLEPFRPAGDAGRSGAKTTFTNTLKDDELPSSSHETGISELDESLASFVTRRLGSEFLDYAINPMVGGIYAGKPERLSVKHAFPKVYALETEFGSLIMGSVRQMLERKRSGTVPHKKRVLSFKNGLGELIKALETRLNSDLLLNRAVRAVSRKPDGTYEVTTDASSTTDSSGLPRATDNGHPPAANTFRVDQLIFAGTTGRLNDIRFENMPGLPDMYIPTLNYAPVVSVTLGYAVKNILHPLDGFGVLVPEVENMNILGCLFTSSIFPGRAPDGHAALTVFVGGMRGPELVELPDEKLLRLVRADLGTLLGVKGEPEFVHLKRWKEAIPQYETGFSTYLKRIDDIETQNPGFHFAGNYRTGISLDACIRHSWRWDKMNM